MSLIIPSHAKLWTPEELARQQREEEIAAAQSAYVDLKTKQSERGLNAPETIEDTTLLATSMNWDYSPGWEQRRLRHVKRLKAQRIPFRPSARVRMPGGGVQNVYEGDHVDLQWFERGDCCVRCCQWKSEDSFQHQRDHALLQEKTGKTPPAGVPLKDLCGFCGNRLDLQKFRTEAA